METENNQNVALCDLCGERPGSVEVTFVAGGEQRRGLLCERCARAALARQQGLVGRGPGRARAHRSSGAVRACGSRPAAAQLPVRLRSTGSGAT